MINQVFEGEPLLTYAVALAGWLDVLTYGDTIQETSSNDFLRLVHPGRIEALIDWAETTSPVVALPAVDLAVMQLGRLRSMLHEDADRPGRLTNLYVAHFESYLVDRNARIRIAMAVADARRNQEWSPSQLAERLLASPGRVAEIEAAQSLVSEAEAAALDRVPGLPGHPALEAGGGTVQATLTRCRQTLRRIQIDADTFALRHRGPVAPRTDP